jgi:dGTPase
LEITVSNAGCSSTEGAGQPGSIPPNARNPGANATRWIDRMSITSQNMSSYPTAPHSTGTYTWHQREQALLASYATFSRHNVQRVYAENLHPTRGPFERDRDRVLHSAAFRRLSGKMQVFTGEMGDYHRTRLTHTFEVASIARTIGRALRLNEDLIEALALLHDIGHPPFGHCGEDVLDECLADVGGFSHNKFALTLVEELETRYSSYPGLNLSEIVLNAQRFRVTKDPLHIPCLEVQVVDAADSIAYNAHDVDDALKLGLIGWQALRTIEIVKIAETRARQNSTAAIPADRQRPALVHALIDLQVQDFIRTATERLETCDGLDSQAVRDIGVRISLSDSLALQRRQLEVFLFDRVYRHPRLIEVRTQAAQQLRTLFELFQKHPERMPLRFQERAARTSLVQGVGEYLAGMTDRFCRDQYQAMIHLGYESAPEW